MVRLRHEFTAVLISDCVFAQAWPVFCSLVQPEHAERNVRVLKRRRRPARTCPTARSPSSGDWHIEPADIQRQLPRKQHLRLHDVAALSLGAPDRANAHEILEAVYATAMHVQRAIVVVDVQTVADIHDSRRRIRSGWHE